VILNRHNTSLNLHSDRFIMHGFTDIDRLIVDESNGATSRTDFMERAEYFILSQK